MRRIKQEIEGCMTGLTRTERALTAHFLFPEEFVGFQGHFPAKKILPGACQIICALAVIARGEERPPRLREVMLAKYAAPIFPDEEVVCTIQRITREDGEGIFKAQLSKAGQRVTELKLRVAL